MPVVPSTLNNNKINQELNNKIKLTNLVLGSDRHIHGTRLAHSHVVLGEHAEPVVGTGLDVHHGVAGPVGVCRAHTGPHAADAILALDEVRGDAGAAVATRTLPGDDQACWLHVGGGQVLRLARNVWKEEEKSGMRNKESEKK